MPDPRSSRVERAALVSVVTGRQRRWQAEHSMDELAGLARAAGADVVLRITQEKARPDPATFLGSGKVAALGAACAELDVDVVIFDHELSPAQLRQLEDRLERKVVDRTQLILDIFARRARTREGKWQVELAQLQYLLPRLAGSGAVLSRLGGGIGTRGPGETKLETDRRRIRQRIHQIERDIEQVRRRRAQLRERRQKRETPTVALVGYTNAGKSTLFSRLTGEPAEASDALFVTLDPLLRRVALPDNRHLLLSDTVGFIDRLPHSLVAAFRATLEEVADADLVLHVIDAASPDRERHVAAVGAVLGDMGAADVERLDVYNKCDLLSPPELARLQAADPSAVYVSARRGDGRQELLETIASRLALDVQRVRLEFDGRAGETPDRVARVYRHGRVVEHAVQDGRVTIVADVPRRLLGQVRPGRASESGDEASGADRRASRAGGAATR